MKGYFAETKKMNDQGKNVIAELTRAVKQEHKELYSRVMVIGTRVDQLFNRLQQVQIMMNDYVNGKAAVCQLEQPIPPADEVKDEARLLEKLIPPGDKVKDEACLLEKQILSANKVVNGEAPVARVIISCPEKGDFAGKLVLLPDSFEKLLELGKRKYVLLATKVLTKNGAEIDCVDVIRDGDHLVFATIGSGKVAASPSLCSIL